jgi:hypothetical protein
MGASLSDEKRGFSCAGEPLCLPYTGSFFGYEVLT